MINADGWTEHAGKKSDSIRFRHYTPAEETTLAEMLTLAEQFIAEEGYGLDRAAAHLHHVAVAFDDALGRKDVRQNLRE